MDKKKTIALLLGIAVTCGLIIHYTKDQTKLSSIIDASNDTFPLESTTTPRIMVTPVTDEPPASTTNDVSTSSQDVTNDTAPDSTIPVIPPPLPPHNDSVTPSEPVTKGECRPGGCSNQLCTDQPDIVSTCEWREEYACYQKATCERQPSGECGWVETPELTQCLSTASEYQLI